MRKRYILLIFLFFFSLTISAQQKIDGLVEDNETGEAVSYASVMPPKGQMIVTDSSGKFSFTIRRLPKLNDSLSISAIGYLSKKIAVKDLITNKKVKLTLEENILDQVKIYASLKGDERRFGYFREWQVKNNDGEIGYVFDLPKQKFQIGQVQVKVNHNYDTCWLKLHLRNVSKVGFNEPQKEIVRKKTILSTTTKNGLVEFDLDWEEITITSNKLYVGFELIKCGCSESNAPSFFFMGNEEGMNYYKDPVTKRAGKNSDEDESPLWKRGVDYTIYIRMFTK